MEPERALFMNIAAGRTFRIASYNVLNLFDNVDAPDKRDEGTPPKSAESQAALADVIEDSQADVIALQEVAFGWCRGWSFVTRSFVTSPS